MVTWLILKQNMTIFLLTYSLYYCLNNIKRINPAPPSLLEISLKYSQRLQKRSVKSRWISIFSWGEPIK
jgi:hypothetical protein